MPYPLLLHSNPFTSPLPQTPSTLFTHTQNSSVTYPLEYLESKIVFVFPFHHKGHWYMLSSGHGTPTHHLQHTSTHHIQHTPTHLGCSLEPKRSHHSDVGPGDGEDGGGAPCSRGYHTKALGGIYSHDRCDGMGG